MELLHCLCYSHATVVFCFISIKVAVHTCDVLWRENLAKTHSQASLNTSCIVSLFNPIELWSIAMPCDGQ